MHVHHYLDQSHAVTVSSACNDGPKSISWREIGFEIIYSHVRVLEVLKVFTVFTVFNRPAKG